MSISAKYIQATIDGVEVRGNQEWSVLEDSHVLDGQTAKHQGYSADRPSSPSARITLMLAQDTKNGEYSRVRRGTAILGLKLFRSNLDPVPAFTFPVANVMTSENAGQVKGRWTVRVTAANYGPYDAADPGADIDEE